jgi:hypothetical protein
MEKQLELDLDLETTIHLKEVYPILKDINLNDPDIHFYFEE